MAIENDFDITKKLCEIFGLNAEKVSSIKINIEQNSFPVAYVEMIPTDEQLAKVAELVKGYVVIQE